MKESRLNFRSFMCFLHVALSLPSSTCRAVPVWLIAPVCQENKGRLLLYSLVKLRTNDISPFKSSNHWVKATRSRLFSPQTLPPIASSNAATISAPCGLGCLDLKQKTEGERLKSQSGAVCVNVGTCFPWVPERERHLLKFCQLYFYHRH